MLLEKQTKDRDTLIEHYSNTVVMHAQKLETPGKTFYE